MKWGTFALVEATRALMRASLEDPLNQKFVLLSEAGIPLYPPDLLYVQLMSEDKSRIDACAQDGVRVVLHTAIMVYLRSVSSADGTSDAGQCTCSLGG